MECQNTLKVIKHQAINNNNNNLAINNNNNN